MASTYSDRLRLELQTNGENSNSWGTQLNSALSRIDDSIAGMATIATTGGSTTLSANNGSADESRMAIIKVTGVLVSNATLTIPAQTKTYVVWNATTGAYTVTLKTSGGTGVVVAQGKKAFIFCDATDCFTAFDDTVLSTPVINESKGSSVASAATTSDIWAVTGSTVHITGTTGMSGFPAAPQAGVWRNLVFDDAVLLTDGANFVVPGGNYTTAADDLVFVYADTTTKFYLFPFRADGTAIAGVSSVSWTGGIVSIATATTTPAFTIAGTSGGIPYFNSGTTWATSAALAASAIVLGGGAGAAPATTTTGTGVVTALGVNVGSAGAFVTFNGAGGTPSSLTGTNITGTAAGLTAGNVITNANLTGHVTSTGNAAVLGSFTLAQLNTAVSDADVLATNGSAASLTGLPIGGITMNTARLLGRTTAGAGVAEEITVGSGLSLAAGALTATAGAAALTLLSTVTASASATVDVETTFSSTYDVYVLECTGVLPATDATNLLILMKIGGSYVTTGYLSHVSICTSNDSATYSAIVSDGTSIPIASSVLNTAGYGGNFTIHIYNPASTSIRKMIHVEGVYLDSGGRIDVSYGAGYNSGAAALTGIQFKMSSGNITSGTFRLYGIANT